MADGLLRIIANKNQRIADLDELLRATEAERDRLRDHADALDEVVGGLHNDLHRLQAVVDAVRTLWDSLTDADEDGAVKRFPVAHFRAVDGALAQLDVSPTMGTCPDCGNPLRYCDCPDVSPDTGGSDHD